MRRRNFLATAAALQVNGADSDSADRVYAFGDGIPRTPAEYARLLASLTADDRVEADAYSRGGVVAKLEERMARLLGKETAVWLPTGTLANQLAVRLLAREGRRVLVQADSHLYRDCGDCAQTLSQLTLIPLAAGKATFTLNEAEDAAGESMMGRVAAPVGAIQIETPVRRQFGRRFDFDQMRRISAWARERRMGLHLDGARLFIETAYTRRPVTEYTGLFDTVYVSLWKYFNAASGAILAGPASLLSNLWQTRRMFGGSLPAAWPFAAVALNAVEGFEERFRKAIAISAQVIYRLEQDANFQIERIPEGTNVFRLKVVNVNAPVYQLRAESAGLALPSPASDWFTLQVNETWNRLPVQEIYTRFVRALG